MTKEQEDSIEILENTDISTIELAENTDLYTYSIAVKNVLNMLKEKELEIEKYKKIINLMTEHIVSSAIVDDTVCAIKCDCETDIEEDCTHEKMINCTKQYFERKVEDECKR